MTADDAAPSQDAAISGGSRGAAVREASSAAFVLFCLLITSTLLHLGARLPILGMIRIDLLLGAAALLACWMERSGPRPRATPSQEELRVNRRLYILFAYIFFTVPFVQWPGSVVKNGLEPFVKAVLFHFLAAWSINSPRQLKIFICLYTGLQCWRVLEPLYLHVAHGYWGSATHVGGGEFMARLSGAPMDTVNPNGLAFIVVTSIPLLYFIGQRLSIGVRILCWCLIGALVYALLLTGSRSGFLVFAVVVALWIWKSRYKTVAIIAIVIASVAVVPFLTDLQKERYLSIFRSDVAGAETAQGRIEAVKKDFVIALRRPLFGHGLGTSVEANAHFRGYGQISHNLYTEVAQELGFVGLAIYLSLIAAVARAAMSAVRSASAAQLRAALESWVKVAADSIVVLLIVNVVFSFASYGLSDPNWYMLSGLAVATARLATRGAAGSAPSPAPAAVKRSYPWVATERHMTQHHCTRRHDHTVGTVANWQRTPAASRCRRLVLSNSSLSRNVHDVSMRPVSQFVDSAAAY